MELTNLSITELVDLKNRIYDMIYNYKDGYLYICKVRSYGRNWEEKGIYNTYTLQELCYQYSGEDGIVDVYSNNPFLSKIDNYGELMYIESCEDYENWNKYNKLLNTISDVSEQLDKWDDRENLPFHNRPIFDPIDTREDLEYYKNKLSVFDMSFISPIAYSVLE